MMRQTSIFSGRRRALLRGAGGAAALLGAGGAAFLAGCTAPRFGADAARTTAPAPSSASLHTPALRLIGEARLPHRMSFQGTTVGGLSGIDYDPVRDVYHVISDDGSHARFYTARMALGRERLGAPQLLEATLLKQADGKPYPGRAGGAEDPDPESIRWNRTSGTLFWASEGDSRLGTAPGLREMHPDGRLLRDFPLPPMFTPGAGRGPRPNLGFEGMTLTPDGAAAWLALEGPMQQDGPTPAVGAAGGACRFTQIDLRSGRVLRQIAYVPDAIPHAPRPPGASADNGVSEVLMADAHQMLVLERAYMSGVGNSLRLYSIDTRQGSDTQALAALTPGAYQPVRKTLLVDFAQLGLARLDNTEGMCWGPALPATASRPAARSLIFVSDDNFNPRQITQFVALEFNR